MEKVEVAEEGGKKGVHHPDFFFTRFGNLLNLTISRGIHRWDRKKP